LNIMIWRKMALMSWMAVVTPTARPVWKATSRRPSSGCSGSALIVARSRPIGRKRISPPLTYPYVMRSNSDRNYISKNLTILLGLESNEENCARIMTRTLGRSPLSLRAPSIMRTRLQHT
jgi:hypothetical protein